METESQAYSKWSLRIKKDRKGNWRKVDMSVLVFGDDPVQNEIRKRLMENEQALGVVGQGFLACLRRKRLQTIRRDLTAEYYRRASELKWSGFQRG